MPHLPTLISILPISILPILLSPLISAHNASTLSCRPWRPHGPDFTPSYNVKLAFGGKSGGGNATASTPLRLASPSLPSSSPASARTGAVFRLESCNSSSLAAFSTRKATCDPPFGCTLDIAEYLHIVSATSGECLTWNHFGAQSSDLVFAPCDMAPGDLRQLWLGGQEVDYPYGFRNGSHYEGYPYVVPPVRYVQPGVLAGFVLAADHRTMALRANPNTLFELEMFVAPV